MGRALSDEEVLDLKTAAPMHTHWWRVLCAVLSRGKDALLVRGPCDHGLDCSLVVAPTKLTLLDGFQLAWLHAGPKTPLS